MDEMDVPRPFRAALSGSLVERVVVVNAFRSIFGAHFLLEKGKFDARELVSFEDGIDAPGKSIKTVSGLDDLLREKSGEFASSS